MSDKSPRHTLSKKSGKSLKEKRAEKKLKADGGAASDTSAVGNKKR